MRTIVWIVGMLSVSAYGVGNTTLVDGNRAAPHRPEPGAGDPVRRRPSGARVRFRPVESDRA